MPLKTSRTLVSTAEAAEILGVTQGRIRQMVLGDNPVFWHAYLGDKILCLDEAEIKKHARKMQRARDEGSVRGQKPKGFKKDRPGIYHKGGES